MSNPYEMHLKEYLDKAIFMLHYWEDKPDTFWLTWKGNSKRSIINTWKSEVSKRQAAYDKFLALRPELKG